nr:hypothetical protein CFP56_49656 [Quercus suber]
MEVGGVEIVMAHNNNPTPPSATTMDHPKSATPTQPSKGRCSRWLDYLNYKGDWLEETRGSLMVVATVITTITFQPALSPPGGVWGETKNTTSASSGCGQNGNTCEAGTLVLAYNYESVYLAFLVCNTIAFTASLSIIFLLISGFPLKNKVIMGILTFAMCTTLTFLGISYVLAFMMLIPEHLFDRLGINMLIPIYVLLGLIAVVILIHTIRFLHWLGRTICKFIPTCEGALTHWKN